MQAMPRSVLIPAFLVLLCVPGARARAGEASVPRLKIAVVLQPFDHFQTPPSWRIDVGQRALEAGVQEACVDHKTAEPIRQKPRCSDRLIDMPSTDVCLEPVLSDILTVRGCDPNGIAPELVSLSPLKCPDSECSVADAARAGAMKLIVVDAAWSADLMIMTLSAEVVTVATGATRRFVPEEFEPKFRNGSPAYFKAGIVPLAILHWFSRELAIRVLEGKAEGDLPSVLLPTLPTAKMALAAPAPKAEPSEGGRSYKALGWAAVGLGVAAGAGSAVLLAVAAHEAGCLPGAVCRHERGSFIPGIALGAIALGAIVGGTVLLLHETGGLTVSLVPTGMSVGGQF